MSTDTPQPGSSAEAQPASQSDQATESQVPVIGDVLRFLIARIEGLNERRFLQEFSTRTTVNRRTASNWLRQRSGSVRAASAAALAVYFRNYFPIANEAWFQHYSVAEIAREMADIPPPRPSTLTELPETRHEVSADLVGVYQTVRYSFEADEFAEGAKAHFAVEVLRIATAGDRFEFEHYFPIRRVSSDERQLISRGTVLPMGDCYLLVGTHQVVEEGYLRPRAYLLPRTPAGVRQPMRYGLIMSTASGNKRPCAARMALQRIVDAQQWSPEQMHSEIGRRVRFATEEEIRAEYDRYAHRILDHIDNQLDPTTANGFVLSALVP